MRGGVDLDLSPVIIEEEIEDVGMDESVVEVEAAAGIEIGIEAEIGVATEIKTGIERQIEAETEEEVAVGIKAEAEAESNAHAIHHIDLNHPLRCPPRPVMQHLPPTPAAEKIKTPFNA